MPTILLVAAVAMHGLGHVLFLGPALGFASWGSGHSWLLTDLLGDGPARTLAALVWIAAAALFITGVMGFLRDADWWSPMTIAAAGISLLGTVVYWDGIRQPSGAAALGFNVAVLGALLVARWPATAGVAP